MISSLLDGLFFGVGLSVGVVLVVFIGYFIETIKGKINKKK
jgi:hypothetical protein